MFMATPTQKSQILQHLAKVAKAKLHIGLHMVLTYVDTTCGNIIPNK